ncbi:MAG: hypothetical protein ACLP0J_29420 [Solirubrobacteraceae bacterium]
MGLRRRIGVLGVAACMALAGCGSSGARVPPRWGLPLVPGTRVSVDARVCDKGADAFCARELVITGASYRSSNGLLADEHQLLRARGWQRIDATTGAEYGADSPGDKLRISYATAWEELSAVDYGWIKRKRLVALALSKALITHTPTLSVLLQYGAG